MTIARRELIDVSLTRWYHCATRCVRRAFLLGDGLLNRKQWVEDRIEELAGVFVVGVGAFTVMDNHLQLRIGCSAERWQVRSARLESATRSRRRFR